MYNLIAFPHYTCGGLLCDILNKTYSEPKNGYMPGSINSINHSLGKIGDNGSILNDYNVSDMIDALNNITQPAGAWIATHCHPTKELLDNFDKTICITTTTYKSKIYRWARAYYHYYRPTWEDVTGLDLIDKMRETAKNYLLPFLPVKHPNVINLEFADIVEQSAEFVHVIDQTDIEKHMNRWCDINSFLYDINLWAKDYIDCYYQAEYEQKLNKNYRYY